MLISALRDRGRATPAVALPDVALVRVRGGYRPSVVHARANEPIRIAFLREETAACSERVVFPAFGKSTMLPHLKPVVVELPPSPAGTYAFTCDMDILRGRLVVDEDR